MPGNQRTRSKIQTQRWGLPNRSLTMVRYDLFPQENNLHGGRTTEYKLSQVVSGDFICNGKRWFSIIFILERYSSEVHFYANVCRSSFSRLNVHFLFVVVFKNLAAHFVISVSIVMHTMQTAKSTSKGTHCRFKEIKPLADFPTWKARHSVWLLEDFSALSVCSCRTSRSFRVPWPAGPLQTLRLSCCEILRCVLPSNSGVFVSGAWGLHCFSLKDEIRLLALQSQYWSTENFSADLWSCLIFRDDGFKMRTSFYYVIYVWLIYFCEHKV